MRFGGEGDLIPAELPDAVRRLSGRAASFGGDLLVNQAAGGNVSVKIGDTLWVKRSGAWLGDGNASDIIPVPLAPWREAALRDVQAPAVSPVGPRPSIETVLHAAVSAPVVLHVHVVDAVAASILPEPERTERLAEALDGLRWGIVPYFRPGLPLGRAVAQLEAVLGGLDVAVLANHGLIVAGDDPAAAFTLLDEVVRRLSGAVAPTCDPLAEPPSCLWEEAAVRGMSVAPGRAHGIASDPGLIGKARAGCYYPDQAVFLGPRLGLADDSGDRHLPVQILPGKGLLLNAEPARGMAEMLEAHAQILARLPASGQGLTLLCDEEAEALAEWEAEKHRRRQNGSTGP